MTLIDNTPGAIPATAKLIAEVMKARRNVQLAPGVKECAARSDIPAVRTETRSVSPGETRRVRVNM